MTEVRKIEKFYALYYQGGWWKYASISVLSDCPYDFVTMENAEKWVTNARRLHLSDKFRIEKRTEIDELFER